MRKHSPSEQVEMYEKALGIKKKKKEGYDCPMCRASVDAIPEPKKEKSSRQHR
jgi:hypothetical protein